MCSQCKFDSAEWPGDVSERFAFEDEKVDYYDGPQSGWLRCRGCERRLAFKCEELIAGALWHWSVVPAGSATNVDEAFLRGPQEGEGVWLSIVEDRRVGSRCIAATLAFGRVAPPVTS